MVLSGSISSYILAQFEFYLDFEFIELFVLSSKFDDLCWLSNALCRLLKPMGGHLRRRCWPEG